jgi:glycerate kinase
VRVLVAPDRLGDVPAATVAVAIATGWLRYDSTAVVTSVPLSAGGRDLLDVLEVAGAGTWRELTHGRALLTTDGVALVAAPDRAGGLGDLLGEVLTLVPPPTRVVVAVDGTADDGTADDGTADHPVGAVPAWPDGIVQVALDAEPVPPLLARELLGRGAGRVSGVQLVVDAVGLAGLAAAADLVVTAERVFDGGSLLGRVPRGAAWAAQRSGTPCVVLAERVLVGRREYAAAGVDAAYELGPATTAGSADLPGRLADLAERVAATWTSGGR